MVNAIRRAAVFWAAVSLLGIAGAAVAQQAPAQPDKDDVKVTNYQDWEVRCLKSSNPQQCEMTQLIKSADSGSPVMRVVLGYPKQIDTAAMIFILPLGTQLVPGVSLSVDGGQAQRIPFQACLPNGCRADLPVKPALLNKLKNGGQATVTIVGPRGKKMNLDISLMGFTAANKAIE